MPVAPYERQVREAPLPGGQQSAAASEEAFGGGASAAAVGKAAGNLANEGLSMVAEARDKANDIAFIELDTQVANAQTARRVGLEKVKGKDALAASVPSLEEFEKDYQKIAQGAVSDRVKEKLYRTYLLRKQSLSDHHKAWAGSQMEKWTNQAIVDSNTAVYNSILPGATESDLQAAVAQVEANAERLAIYNGIDTVNGVANAKRIASSHVYAIHFRNLFTEKKDAEAKKLYDEIEAYEKETGDQIFTQEDRARIYPAVKAGADLDAMKNMVDKVATEEISETMRPPEKDYGIRADKTQKGGGYYGEFRERAMDPATGKMVYTGRVVTEQSVGVELDPFHTRATDPSPHKWAETEIPTLVPGLNEKQIAYLVDGGDPRQDPEIMRIAIAHAEKRLLEGKSPFASADEVPGITRSRRRTIGETIGLIEANKDLTPEQRRVAMAYAVDVYRQREVIADATRTANYNAAKEWMKLGEDPELTVPQHLLTQLSEEDRNTLKETALNTKDDGVTYGRFMTMKAEDIAAMGEPERDANLAQMGQAQKAHAMQYWVAVHAAKNDPRAERSAQGVLSNTQMLIKALADVPGTPFVDADISMDIGKDDKAKHAVLGKLLAEADPLIRRAADPKTGRASDEDVQKIFDELVLKHYAKVRVRQGFLWMDALNPDDEVNVEDLTEESVRAAYVPIEDISAADKARIQQMLQVDGIPVSVEMVTRVRGLEMANRMDLYDKMKRKK